MNITENDRRIAVLNTISSMVLAAKKGLSLNAEEVKRVEAIQKWSRENPPEGAEEDSKAKTVDILLSHGERLVALEESNKQPGGVH